MLNRTLMMTIFFIIRCCLIIEWAVSFRERCIFLHRQNQIEEPLFIAHAYAHAMFTKMCIGFQFDKHVLLTIFETEHAFSLNSVIGVNLLVRFSRENLIKMLTDIVIIRCDQTYCTDSVPSLCNEKFIGSLNFQVTCYIFIVWVITHCLVHRKTMKPIDE